MNGRGSLSLPGNVRELVTHRRSRAMDGRHRHEDQSGFDYHRRSAGWKLDKYLLGLNCWLRNTANTPRALESTRLSKPSRPAPLVPYAEG